MKNQMKTTKNKLGGDFMKEKSNMKTIKIKLGNKVYRMREEAQYVYEAIMLLLLILASYGLFIIICHLIVFLAKEIK